MSSLLKRKLINYQELSNLQESSLSNAINEIVEAKDIIAETLDYDFLDLESFDENSVLFRTDRDSYLRANYAISDRNIILENIEQLVVDNQSKEEEKEDVLTQMLEAVIDDEEAKASELFRKYMKIDMPLRESRKSSSSPDRYVRAYYTRSYAGEKGTPKLFHRRHEKDLKKSAAAKKAWRNNRSSMLRGQFKRVQTMKKRKLTNKRLKKLFGSKLHGWGGKGYYDNSRPTRKMSEWYEVSQNVLEFVNFCANGEILLEGKIVTNEGKTSLKIPTKKSRNESKVLQIQVNNLSTDVKVLRENAKKLSDDHRFSQMVSEIKRNNNLSDNKELEESIGKLVVSYPAVLYLTERELTKITNIVLDRLSDGNYGDDTCKFISEAILTVAHEVFPDRVKRIITVANSNSSNNDYRSFQRVVEDFFPKIDEANYLESKIYEDLYKASKEILEVAKETNDHHTARDAKMFVEELEEIVERGNQPANLNLAYDAASWIESLIESNIEGEDWVVDREPYETITGDNPKMFGDAKKGYSPDKDFSGDWGDPAPALKVDKASWKNSGGPEEQRMHGFGNKGGKDTYPDLKNPYLIDDGGYKYTMPKDTGVDMDDNDYGTWQSGDTYPNLTNPYMPKSLIPKQLVDPSNQL